jgi:uncharacterized metal-binding protein YceD (DUF177 family)
VTPEFSRAVRIDTLGSGPREISLEASEEEREALARRFGLQEIGILAASVSLSGKPEGIEATGRLSAEVVQSCVVTGVGVPASIDEEFNLRFLPQPKSDSEGEIELGEEELDTVFYEGGAIDVGEAVAETLGLALEPYPRAPGAEEAMRAAGVKDEEDAGPFAALAGLRDKLKG